MAKIYLLRHGQTIYNKEKRFEKDSPLTPQGIEQAKKTANKLKDFNISKIYSSTLIRSIKTAQIIKEKIPQAKLISYPELNEINAGLFGGMKMEDFKKTSHHTKREKDKYNWLFPKGDNYAIKTANLKKILEKVKNQKENIIIVGHQGTNRCIIADFLKINAQELTRLNMPQEEIFEIELENEKVKIFEKNIDPNQILLKGIDIKMPDV
jgi:broad specificity phosphatase PhoE